jgi:hypothetical protein
MAKVRIVYTYDGYPMRRADNVVRENITGDEEWQEYLFGQLEDYGIEATAAEVGSPYPADKSGDWVAVRVPITVTYKGKRKHRLSEYCNNAADYEEGFYCDSCYWEEVK